ncbi:TIGR02450 family Trp-rich protein [Enterovibrio sp. ZSDZ42]|uniref:TIGR02450 family Trp-rich protein n=1 Tax=Enterovibrio gelatinilyticus TaxID=2899819 RepID=A0ABT5R793_9GAMM|nr:TIGR02450 family Trp-rich protein [Enterovibrio sp. ZSDZ42]MDD1796144.1 TIGR02450 family Trp-rich protein [Enterovibrio sp. ZSDZ42]
MHRPKPLKQEKHSQVSDIEFEEDGSMISSQLEAVILKNAYLIDWKDLKNSANWAQVGNNDGTIKHI